MSRAGCAGSDELDALVHVDGKNPLVTVITVVYNAAVDLELTIKSVLAQTRDKMEYIVIDGGSSDDTVDVIKKYCADIDYWSSGPDGGVYDAMNKGVRHARGEWTLFLNAGDTFADEGVIEEFAGLGLGGYDLVYSGHNQIHPDGTSESCSPEPLAKLWKRMVFSHQALFTRTKILIKNPFEIENFAADHKFIYDCYLNGCRFKKYHGFIVNYALGGLSDKYHNKSLLWRWRNSKSNNNSIAIDVYFIYLFIFDTIKTAVKRFVTAHTYVILKKTYYKTKEKVL